MYTKPSEEYLNDNLIWFNFCYTICNLTERLKIRIEKIISASIWATKSFLEVLAVPDVRHCAKLQSCAKSKKANDTTWWKLILGLILAQIWSPKLFRGFLPVLDVKQCCKLSLCAISRKSYEPDLKKMAKNLISNPAFCPNLDPKYFLSRFYLC